MRKCKFLTDTIKGRHKWLWSQIKKEENIKDPTVLQQYQLCTHYEILYHAPFMDDMKEFYECCKTCKFKQNSGVVFNAIYNEKIGR